MTLPLRMTELQAQIHEAKLNPEEVLKEQFSQLNDLDQQFHPIVKTFSPQVGPQGPLHGIGFAHKDLFNLLGREPGFGHDAGKSNQDIETSPVMKMLEAAGASNLAALVMAPYACGATSQNPHFPRCINPLNESYAVGGSSSGSAVAVASKMSYVSLGSDTTGSVRIPSATCGITGLKTSAGLISLQGVAPLSKTLDTIGVLGRYAKDIGIILDIIKSLPLADATKSPRLSFWLPEKLLDPNVYSSIQKFLRQLNITQQIDFMEFDALVNATNIVMAYEINQQYAKEIASENPPKGLKSVSKIAQGISKSQYTQVIESRQKLTQAFIDQYLSSADLLILPCLGQSLPNWTEVEIGHPEFSRDAYLSLFQFMGFVNLLGLPSISFPIGDDARGRPVSIQAIARPLQEKTLLKFAQDMEQQLFDGYCYIDQIHQRRA